MRKKKRESLKSTWRRRKRRMYLYQTKRRMRIKKRADLIKAKKRRKIKNRLKSKFRMTRKRA